jgi:HEAT repeat protein
MSSVESHARKLREANNAVEANEHISALAKKATPAAIKALINNGLTTSLFTGTHATHIALRELGKKSFSTIARFGVTHKDADVVKQSMKLLSEIDPKRAIRPIIKHGLTHKESDVVIKAIDILAETGYTADAAKSIAKHGLSHKDSRVVSHAIEAMEDHIGYPALPYLMGITDHPNKDVREKAKDAIRTICERRR